MYGTSSVFSLTQKVEISKTISEPSFEMIFLTVKKKERGILT
ncbi:hypothetical protein LEP1GSC165_1832 [Leptospira santarosai str. CBC523]|nr:hypothetical protein LEP1GSC165_1832 [Leptospira santarosai str. CBC523]